MKFIANILTEKNFPNEGIYNVVNDKTKLINGIPTLVIGWDFTKLNYPEVNILNWKIDSMTFWTFGMREKRQRYEEDIKNFKKFIFNNIIKTVKYEYVNTLLINNSIDCLTTILKYAENLVIYINNDMLYVTCKDCDKIYGYSLRDLEYIGGNKKDILSIMYSNKSNKIIDNKVDLSTDIKIALKNHLYIIPYLF